MTVVISFFFLKQKFGKNHMAGVSSCLLGCALIITGDVLLKGIGGILFIFDDFKKSDSF